MDTTTMQAILAARLIYGAARRPSEYGIARRVATAILGDREPGRDALRAAIEADLVRWRAAQGRASRPEVR